MTSLSSSVYELRISEVSLLLKSVSKRTLHLRAFFVTDVLFKNEVGISDAISGPSC